jgi:hypothetical protein
MHGFVRLWIGIGLLVLLLAGCGRSAAPAEEAVTPTVEAATPTDAPAAAATATEPAAAAEPAAESTVTSLQAESPLAAPESPLAAPESPLPTPVAVTAKDTGVFIGKVVSKKLPGNPPMADTIVRLGNIFWNEDHTDGNFVIDGANSPGAYTAQDGTFVIANLPPGEYMVVVGDLIGINEVIKTPEGPTKVFTAEAGKLTNLGTLEVNLP